MSWISIISFLLIGFSTLSIKGFSEEKIEPTNSTLVADGYRYGFYYGRPYYYRPYTEYYPYYYRYYYYHPYDRFRYYYGWD